MQVKSTGFSIFRILFFTICLFIVISTAAYSYHSYDADENWAIEDFELLKAIDVWAANNLDDFELLDLIDFWAADCYHWDAVKEQFKAGCHNETTVTAPIESGGFIEFPPESMRLGTEVIIEPARTPLLPDDTQPVSQSFSVIATDPLTGPVFLHLPIPEGIEDPDTLIVYRVEDDGTTTFLVPQIEGDELVAATPGFSTFTLLDLHLAIAQGNYEKLEISGKEILDKGDIANYIVSVVDDDIRLIRSGATYIIWSITGPAEVLKSGEYDAIVRALRPGEADLFASFVFRGQAYYGHKKIQVPVSDENDLRVSVATLQPFILLETNESTACLNFTASVVNADSPIIWSWEFIYDDHTGSMGPTDATTINIPCFEVDTEKGRSGSLFGVPLREHKIIVCAESNGQKACNSDISFVTAVPSLKVTLNGPKSLELTDSPITAEYTAEVDRISILKYFWQVQPADVDFIEGSEVKEISFDQPGNYVVSVKVIDETVSGARGEGTAKLPVVVKGKSLEASFVDKPSPNQGSQQSFNYSVSGSEDSDDPVVAEVGETVSADLLVRHGVLIVNGKKGNYEVKLDWDDGTISPPVTVDAESSVIGGTTGDIAHIYQEANTYTVTATVSDATGHSVQVSEDIIIVEKNSAPVAYSQAVVTDKNTPKAITLGGSDAEDDPLTYTVVSGPDHGALSGSAPNLTYTPATGYTGGDSFSFIVNDGKSDSAQATVSIIVRDGDIVWKLIRTEIMPVSGSYQTSWTSSNGYFTFNSMGQVSEGSMSISRTETYQDGRDTWKGNVRYDFTRPPDMIIGGGTFEITVNGTVKSEVFFADDIIWLPDGTLRTSPRFITSAALRSDFADSNGQYSTAYPPGSADWLTMYGGGNADQSESKVLTGEVKPYAVRFGITYQWRIEMHLSSEYSPDLIAAWIYEAE